jgi:hypothetical protein
MAHRNIAILLKGVRHVDDGQAFASIFEKLLAYGKSTSNNSYSSSESLLFELFGLETEQEKDVPVAAVTRLLDLGVVDKGWWMRADPVHLVAGQQGLIMLANSELDLSSIEAEALVDEITDAMADEGWTLKVPNPHRWYLKPAEIPQITTTPLEVVMGRDVHGYLPVGEHGKNWHTRLNEIQILLHTSQVNLEREAAGKLSANSVWFWGGGSLPQLKDSSWTGVWSDDVVALALARLSDTPHHKFPDQPETWSKLAREGNHLLVIDWERFTHSADELDRKWGEWLINALKRSDVDNITVYLGTEKQVVIQPGDIRKRWSWRFPFSRN